MHRACVCVYIMYTVYLSKQSIYTYLFTSIYTHIYIHRYIHRYIQLHTHTHTHRHTYTYTYIPIPIPTHVHYRYSYIYMCTHIHQCICFARQKRVNSDSGSERTADLVSCITPDPRSKPWASSMGPLSGILMLPLRTTSEEGHITKKEKGKGRNVGAHTSNL